MPWQKQFKGWRVNFGSQLLVLPAMVGKDGGRGLRQLVVLRASPGGKQQRCCCSLQCLPLTQSKTSACTVSCRLLCPMKLAINVYDHIGFRLEDSVFVDF